MICLFNDHFYKDIFRFLQILLMLNFKKILYLNKRMFQIYSSGEGYVLFNS